MSSLRRGATVGWWVATGRVGAKAIAIVSVVSVVSVVAVVTVVATVGVPFGLALAFNTLFVGGVDVDVIVIVIVG